jgi:hypothetical protein
MILLEACRSDTANINVKSFFCFQVNVREKQQTSKCYYTQHAVLSSNKHYYLVDLIVAQDVLIFQ